MANWLRVEDTRWMDHCLAKKRNANDRDVGNQYIQYKDSWLPKGSVPTNLFIQTCQCLLKQPYIASMSGLYMIEVNLQLL